MSPLSKYAKLTLGLLLSAALSGTTAFADATFSPTSYFSANNGQDYLQRWNSSTETGASDQIYNFDPIAAHGGETSSGGLAVSPDRNYVFQFRSERPIAGTGNWQSYLYRFDANGNETKFSYTTGAMGYIPSVPQVAYRTVFTPNNTLLAVGGTTLNEVSQNGLLIRSFSVNYNGSPINFDSAFYATDGYLYGIDHYTGLFKIDPNTDQVLSCTNGQMFGNRCAAVYIAQHNTFALTGWTNNGAIYDLNGNQKTGQSIDASTGGFIDLGYDPNTDRVLRLTWDSNRDGFGQWDANPANPTYGQRVNPYHTMYTLGRTPGFTTSTFGNGSVDIINSTSAAQFSYLATSNKLTPPPVFHQQGTDAPWQANNLLGNTHGYTMASAGCYVTATTMALDSFGHTATPGQFNSLMTSTYKGQYTDGLLRYWMIPTQNTYGQSDGQTAPAVRFLAGNFGAADTKQQIIDRLSQLIQNDGPVILSMPQYGDGLADYKNGTTHAVVAWKVVGNQVYIRNPLNQSTSTDQSTITLDSYINWVNASVSSANALDANYAFLHNQGFSYAQLATATAKTVLSGGASSSVDFVITDPLGRRLGYDPVLNLTYNEIPDSAYFRLSPGGDGTINSTLPIEYQIGEIIPGQYSVHVFGDASGSYSLDLGASGASGYTALNSFAGSFDSAGDTADYSFSGAVPEPASLALLALPALALLGRRKR